MFSLESPHPEIIPNITSAVMRFLVRVVTLIPYLVSAVSMLSTCWLVQRPTIIVYAHGRSWLVGCFGFNGPLKQYFSLYRAVSQREGERKEKNR